MPDDLSPLALAWLNEINSLAWGWPTISLLFGLGLYLTIGLRFMPIRNIGKGFSELIRGRQSTGPGEIPPARALMTALSATVGTGNIAGVATAIAIGGPGAIFWMWIMALLGMATKYSEAVLAVHYREVTPNGEYLGGPMYYIRKGLGERWAWLAFLFALFATIAGFGIGNMIQSNSVADVMHHQFNIDEWITGLGVAVLAGVVILGGLKRIAAVATRLVPLMIAAYILAALVVLALHWAQIPGAFVLIIESAFTGHAATGGFLGTTVMMAIQIGVSRGIFSNEAGLGTASIAHAAAMNSSPVRQGQVAMLGTFIDTLIVCTITALVILTTGAWSSGASGAALSAAAFSHGLHGVGGLVVSIALAVFAFTTILGWAFYGSRCARYLFGDWITTPYKILWVIALYVGSTVELETIWTLADTLNAFMAWPNLIGLLLLSPIVFKLTRELVK